MRNAILLLNLCALFTYPLNRWYVLGFNPDSSGPIAEALCKLQERMVFLPCALVGMVQMPLGG